LENNRGLFLRIGYNCDDLIKTDILYCDSDFLFPIIEEESIRMANVEEIAAMKLDVISRGGRKKDFWDLVEILEDHSLADLLTIYEKKYPYFPIDDVKNGLTNFSVAEEMPDPICLKSKKWDLIKASISDAASKL
jgi:hypothetical protein